MRARPIDRAAPPATAAQFCAHWRATTADAAAVSRALFSGARSLPELRRATGLARGRLLPALLLLDVLFTCAAPASDPAPAASHSLGPAAAPESL